MLGLSSITSFFNAQETETNSENTSSVDIVIYALGLASNPQLIEPYREHLREITAKIPPGQKEFSQETQSSLKTLYLDVEQYLIEKEPLKKILKDELRKNITKKFNLEKNNGKTFWDKLSE